MAVKMVLRRVNTENKGLKEEFLLADVQADLARERLKDMYERSSEETQGRPVFVRFRDVHKVDHFYRVDEIRHVSFTPGMPDPETEE